MKSRLKDLMAACLVSTLGIACSSGAIDDDASIDAEPSSEIQQSFESSAEAYFYFNGSTVPASTSYNSFGKANDVRPLTSSSTGNYQVLLRGLWNGPLVSNVQVSVVERLGHIATSCVVSTGGSAAPDIELYVNCFDSSGRPANAAFVLSYVAYSGGTALSNTGAYLRYNHRQNSTSSQWGAVSRTRRLDLGRYQVELDGHTQVGGTVHVTGRDVPGFSGYCKVQNWFPQSGKTLINVNCFAQNGAPQDFGFDLRFMRDISASEGGYVWANRPTEDKYVPHTSYNKRSWTCSTQSSSDVSIERKQPSVAGEYLVSYPGLANDSGVPLVTAYGSGSDFCRLRTWFVANDGVGSERVAVSCYNTSGGRVDSMFTTSYMTYAQFIC